MMTRIFAFSLLLLLPLILCAQSAPPEFFDVKFDPTANPVKQLDAAKVEAAKSGKRILLDVGGEWCSWCHRLDQLYRSNPDLAEFLKANFIPVKINVSTENKNADFLAQFPKFPGYPHIFVLDEKGKLLHSQDTGALEEGKGHSKTKVMEFLKQWAKKTS